MRIGYACLILDEPQTQLKSCMQKNATPERLLSITGSNLAALGQMMAYNQKNSIRLFRISSDIIPFGSSPVNRLAWREIFSPELAATGAAARRAGIRLSMHPGQYTVFNSPNAQVVQRAMADLQYHAAVLDSLGMGPECKLILHVGGVYGNRREALLRFAAHFAYLDEAVSRRLVLENDDRSFPITDVLELAARLNLPAVYDQLHNAVLPADSTKTDAFWICACQSTWQSKDGPQKIHYSQQDPAKRPGAHALSIDTDVFLRFCAALPSRDIDIMLEVKDKNLSALRCMKALSIENQGKEQAADHPIPPPGA